MARSRGVFVVPSSLTVTTVLAVAAAGVALAPLPAGARSAPPSWLRGAESLHEDPRTIVDRTVDGDPLEVTVTQVKNGRPVFVTLPAKSRADAESIVRRAQANPANAAVEMNPTAVPAGTDTYYSEQWALKYLAVSTARKYTRGAGVQVAVVDTGVQSSHPDLEGRVLSPINMTSEPASDYYGHGTHVAGTIAANGYNSRGVMGVADRVMIRPVKVFKQTAYGPSASGSTIAAGMTKAVDAGAKVLNLSLVTAGRSSAIETAVNYAASKGAVTVAAAGNRTSSGCPTDSDDGKVYPAASAGVIGVGAIQSDGTLADFSCRGSWVDLTAPGRSIKSTVKGSSYSTKSGTSMATPHVAAAAALLYERLGAGATVASVSSTLASTAADKGAGGRDSAYGSGVVRPAVAIKRVMTKTRFAMPDMARSGSTATIRARLVRYDGSNVANVPITMTTSFNGSGKSFSTTTNAEGVFWVSATFWHNSSWAARFAGGSYTRASTTWTTFSDTWPDWSKQSTSSSVTVSVKSRYGQTLSLQKYYDGAWRTKKTSLVDLVSLTLAKLLGTNVTFSTGAGKWRVVSSGTDRLARVATSSWTS